jgi:hypothetical protein
MYFSSRREEKIVRSTLVKIRNILFRNRRENVPGGVEKEKENCEFYENTV